jgi:hypothetical protein
LNYDAGKILPGILSVMDITHMASFRFTALTKEMPVAPSIDISPQTFARLQACAIPLVDNIETVITRLIDFYEAREGAPVPGSGAEAASEIRQFNPLSPPILTHTKVLAVEFCGRPLEHRQANWNGLLDAAVREAKARANSASELKQLVIIPFVEGRRRTRASVSCRTRGFPFKGRMRTARGKALVTLLSDWAS